MPDNSEIGAFLHFSQRNTIPASTTLYNNTDEEFILIRKEALQLILQENVDLIAKRDRWMAPLGLLVPIVLTLPTAVFTRRLGISPDAWETVIILLAIAAASWLISELLLRRGSRITAGDIIEKLARNPVIIKSSPVAISPITDGSPGDLPSWAAPTEVTTQESNAAGGADSGQSHSKQNPAERPSPEAGLKSLHKILNPTGSALSLWPQQKCNFWALYWRSARMP